MNDKEKVAFLAVLTFDIMGATTSLGKQLQNGVVPEDTARLDEMYERFKRRFNEYKEEHKSLD